ncbi:hypothetical protein [Leekyejoonella antrihumi]|uniref:Glycoside hydrolase family 15 n=1 Tax=Leekyejoonella antrihumi TaxID=1660198 RepID=A0A563E5S1_9MICO|nr:hypothetical protein [Leekyejoonella antrihumi]TWP37867.1 hypothetical protein FGL98_03900 [Leekyejoonella antrihumi]
MGIWPSVDALPGGPGRAPSRRQVLTGAAGGLFLAGTGGGIWATRPQDARINLLSRSVGFSGPGERVLLRSADAGAMIGGTRVLTASTDTDRLVAEAQAWLDAAPAWSRSGAMHNLAQSALLDLQVLSADLPAPVAGWSRPWRYVWPRDASAASVALAIAGQPDLAYRALTYLQRVQHEDGWFEARYIPGTARTPDNRLPQLDGTGWVLWAADRVHGVSLGTAAMVRDLRPMLTRSTTRILRSIDIPSGLPAACPDYWETPERTTTLGTCAVLAAGLESAARVLPVVGEKSLAAEAAAGLTRLDATIEKEFGRYGYPRHPRRHDPDAATALLLPPFRQHASPTVLAALDRSASRMKRPAGGLAPGSSWQQDGVSWTPETSLYAVASAASGRRGEAWHWLTWLSDHRTSAGSFPEKVLAGGRPASVAPLTWTAAMVLLALHHLA